MVIVWCAISVISSFAIISLGKRELDCILISGSVYQSRDAAGWSAVCDCDISCILTGILT